MTNPYYVKTFDVAPGSKVASQAIEDQFLLVEQGADLLNTAINLKAPLANAALTGVPTADTAAVGVATRQLATTAFVAATSFSTNLPGQTSSAGKFLTTDGSAASWDLPFASQTSNSGKVLGTNGTTTSWVSRGMILLATLTPTAAANVDFLSTFTSDYDDYVIIYQGIKPATTNDLRIRLAISGAASAANTYYTANANSTGVTAATSESLTNGTSVLSSGYGANGTVIIRNANSTAGDKSITRHGEFQDAVGYLNTAAGASFTTVGAITGFRLFWAAGSNFSAAGSVRVYGLSKV